MKRIIIIIALLLISATSIYAEEITLTTIMPSSDTVDYTNNVYAVSEGNNQYDPGTNNTKVSVNLEDGVWFITVYFEAKRSVSFSWKVVDESSSDAILIGGDGTTFWQPSYEGYYTTASGNKIYTISSGTKKISLQFYVDYGYGYLNVKNASIFARRIAPV